MSDNYKNRWPYKDEHFISEQDAEDLEEGIQLLHKSNQDAKIRFGLALLKCAIVSAVLAAAVIAGTKAASPEVIAQIIGIF